MASIARRPDGTWRPRYRDAADKEHSRHFARKLDAQRWLDEVTPASSRASTSTQGGPGHLRDLLRRVGRTAGLGDQHRPGDGPGRGPASRSGSCPWPSCAGPTSSSGSSRWRPVAWHLGPSGPA